MYYYINAKFFTTSQNIGLYCKLEKTNKTFIIIIKSQFFVLSRTAFDITMSMD